MERDILDSQPDEFQVISQAFARPQDPPPVRVDWIILKDPKHALTCSVSRDEASVDAA